MFPLPLELKKSSWTAVPPAAIGFARRGAREPSKWPSWLDYLRMPRLATLCFSALVMLAACGRLKPSSSDGSAAGDGPSGDGASQPDASVDAAASDADLDTTSADGAVDAATDAPSDAPVDAPTLGDALADGRDAADGGRVPYRAIAVATGEVQTCALLDDHRVKCWGDNGVGELGYGDQRTRGRSSSDMGDALPTVDLGTGRTAIAIGAGRYTTCAILDDGSLRCWGWRGLSGVVAENDIGDEPGEMGDHLKAIDFGGRKAVHFAMGEYAACASTDDDTIWCWYEGEPPRLMHELPVKPVRAFGPSGGGVMAVYQDGTLSAELPGGSTSPSPTFDRKAIAVAGSATSATCVLFEDATTACVNGSPSYLPKNDVIAIGAERVGGFCTARSDGTVMCHEQYCAQPTYYSCAADGSFDLGVPAVSVSSNGTEFACALLADGNIKCWGANLTMPPAAWLGAGIEFTQTDAGITYGAWRPVDLGTHL
jgi:hypothetical protein